MAGNDVPGLLAGFARADVSPEVGEGYWPFLESRVHKIVEPLTARVVYLETPGEEAPVVLAMADHIGFTRKADRRMRPGGRTARGFGDSTFTYLRETGYMLIDAHNHPNWWGHDARKILKDMDEQGIERMWLLSWECPETDYSPKLNDHVPIQGGGIPLKDVLEVGREAPDRFILGYMPHPGRPDAIDRLKAAVEIHGIRLAGELKARMLFDDPDAIRLYHVCGELGLPITLHLEYAIDGKQKYPRPNYWYGGSMDALERAIAACPETVFIGHAKGFWAHISGDDQFDKVPAPKGPVLPGGRVSEMLTRYGNLYGDLSASGLRALERDPDFSQKFLIEFQDKLLWGRDHFHAQLMDFLRTLNLPQEVFEKITYRNARKLLGE